MYKNSIKTSCKKCKQGRVYKGAIALSISDEGAKPPPPPNIFRTNAKKNDMVRTCKERTVKCEIKSILEKFNNKACCTKALL